MFNILFFTCFLLILNLLHQTSSYITVLYIFTIYIILSGYYLFFINADLMCGFLWVIDFNLLFIFLLFGIYLLHIFKNDSKKINHNYKIIIKFIYIISMYLVINAIYIYNVNLLYINIPWLITYINYYNLYIYNIKTNLFVLYITYFKLNVDLFLSINLILFFSIILTIYLFININLLKIKSSYFYINNKYTNIQKIQNITTQKHKFINFNIFK